MREGWKCPVCGKGVSPDQKDCDHGGMVTLTPVHPQRPEYFLMQPHGAGMTTADVAPNTHTWTTSC